MWRMMTKSAANQSSLFKFRKDCFTSKGGLPISLSTTRKILKTSPKIEDEHQYKVIHADEQTVRLVAPAGSGKTQTVVNRVLNLVKHGTHPDRILMLTFDTSAARALRDKGLNKHTRWVHLCGTFKYQPTVPKTEPASVRGVRPSEEEQGQSLGIGLA